MIFFSLITLLYYWLWLNLPCNCKNQIRAFVFYEVCIYLNVIIVLLFIFYVSMTPLWVECRTIEQNNIKVYFDMTLIPNGHVIPNDHGNFLWTSMSKKLNRLLFFNYPKFSQHLQIKLVNRRSLVESTVYLLCPRIFGAEPIALAGCRSFSRIWIWASSASRLAPYRQMTAPAHHKYGYTYKKSSLILHLQIKKHMFLGWY